MKVIPPLPVNAIVKNGIPNLEMTNWMESVSDLVPRVDSGSPEGVLEARQGALYIDQDGSSGSRFYFKLLAEIGGDRTKGWVND